MGKFKENFNFISNIILLIIIFLGGIVWADTNGIWHNAEDIKGGIFGYDEQDSVSIGFRFINPLQIDNDFKLTNITNCNGKLMTNNLGLVSCGVDNVNDSDSDPNNEKPLSGLGITISDTTVSINSSYTQRRIDSNCQIGQYISKINENGSINCEIDVVGLTAENDPEVGIVNTGKWCIGNGGTVNCNQDSPILNEIDGSTTNEIQNLNSVLSTGNDGGGKIVSNIADPINNQDAATKKYVDTKLTGGSSTPITRISTFTTTTYRWPAGTANCNSDEIVVGGGAVCSSEIGWMMLISSIPQGNGWYGACDSLKNIYATINVYAICLKK